VDTRTAPRFRDIATTNTKTFGNISFAIDSENE
jgi:hypothetical protein